MGWYGLDWSGSGGELLWIRHWAFGFHEMLGNYWVAWHLVVSRVVLSSIELVRVTISFYWHYSFQYVRNIHDSDTAHHRNALVSLLCYKFESLWRKHRMFSGERSRVENLRLTGGESVLYRLPRARGNENSSMNNLKWASRMFTFLNIVWPRKFSAKHSYPYCSCKSSLLCSSRVG
jgi:hypothetical protein